MTYADCRIVYSVTGEKYVREAMASARSAKAVMPDIRVDLFVDEPSAAALGVREGAQPFDSVRPIASPEFSFADKLAFVAHYTSERVLFLDGDTTVIQPVYDLFDLLGRFELVCCHAPWRFSPETPKGGDPITLDLPPAFCEVNGGVIGARMSDRVRRFFEGWRTTQAETNHWSDQVSLRLELWRSDLNFYVMPPEFNVRYIMPFMLGGYAAARILHGRGVDNPQALGRHINARQRPRVFDLVGKC